MGDVGLVTTDKQKLFTSLRGVLNPAHSMYGRGFATLSTETLVA